MTANLELRNLKGTKDYLPAEQRLRNRIKNTLEGVFARYGFRPLETPLLCHYDILASKYAGGEEILKEIYRLQDQGGRELALRYDLTVPLARVIGMNPNLRLPFKRYELGPVFRDGPVKTGRLRQFMQCDVDIVGVGSQIAEAELMIMVLDAFSELGLDVYIEYNNRKLLSGVLLNLGVPAGNLNNAILSLDKVDKIGAEAVKQELQDQGLAPHLAEDIFTVFKEGRITAYYSSRFDDPLIKEGIEELNRLDDYLDPLQGGQKLCFNPLLARGLEIYTGTVFEVFLSRGKVKSSVAAGGRYDQIIGAFLENGQEYPAVGISFGLDVIFTVLSLEEKRLHDPTADIFLIPLDTVTFSLELARNLRRKGLRVEMELSERRLKRSLDYANKEGIPFVLILGENELARKEVKLRHMNSGKEDSIALSELVDTLRQLIAEF